MFFTASGDDDSIPTVEEGFCRMETNAARSTYDKSHAAFQQFVGSEIYHLHIKLADRNVVEDELYHLFNFSLE